MQPIEFLAAGLLLVALAYLLGVLQAGARKRRGSDPSPFVRGGAPAFIERRKGRVVL